MCYPGYFIGQCIKHTNEQMLKQTSLHIIKQKVNTTTITKSNNHQWFIAFALATKSSLNVASWISRLAPLPENMKKIFSKKVWHSYENSYE